MEAVKQHLHTPFFLHVVRGINWANIGAMAIMVIYLLALFNADYLRGVVKAIHGVPW
jgi:hypothetical protein